MGDRMRDRTAQIIDTLMKEGVSVHIYWHERSKYLAPYCSVSASPPLRNEKPQLEAFKCCTSAPTLEQALEQLVDAIRNRIAEHVAGLSETEQTLNRLWGVLKGLDSK